MSRKPGFLPYGRQYIDKADIAAVEKILQSDFLTTGPTVQAFEQAFAIGAGHMEFPPASAFYGINELLHPDLMIEIEATAIVGDQQ